MRTKGWAKGLGFVVGVLFCIMAGVALADGGGGGRGMSSNDGARVRELGEVREQLEAAAKEIETSNRKHRQLEHDIVYSNATAKVLYEDIKRLEKQLVQKKRELTDVLRTLPQMREAEKRRASAYETQRRLRAREQLILKDRERRQRLEGAE